MAFRKDCVKTIIEASDRRGRKVWILFYFLFLFRALLYFINRFFSHFGLTWLFI